MPFCVTYEEYLQNQDIYDLVSGPWAETCMDCSVSGLGGSVSGLGGFFEIAVQPQQLGSLSGEQLIFLNTNDFNIHSYASNVIFNQIQGVYAKCRIFNEPVSYNSPWTFRLNLEDFISVSDVEQEKLDISPTIIEQMISEGSIQNGDYIYFSFSGKSRPIDVKGVVYCGRPLSLSVRNVLESGKYVIESYCDGECSERTNDGLTEECLGYEEDKVMDALGKETKEQAEEKYSEEFSFDEILDLMWFYGLTEEEQEEYSSNSSKYEDNIEELGSSDERYEELNLD